MAKLALSDVSNLSGNPGSAQTTINANSAAIETALENTLSRDGTSPNTMNADLDMNGNQILNVGEISYNTGEVIVDTGTLLDEIKLVDGAGSGIDSDLLDGQQGSYYLDVANHTGFAEAVDDRLNTVLVAGTNITLTYNDGANTLTIDAAGGGGPPGAIEYSSKPAGAYTLVIDDANIACGITGNVTVPTNASVAFDIGTTVLIVNEGTTTRTISSSATLRHAGLSTTGTAYLYGYGIATLYKTGTDTWYVSGPGVSNA